MVCAVCKSPMKHLTLDLWECPECRLISSDVSPDPSLYDKSYLTKYARYDNTHKGDEIRKMRRLTVQDAARGLSARRLLDFGCATGSFLQDMAGFGWEVSGYDINPYGVYTDPTVLFDHYGAVTLWDVIEHMPRPVELLDGLHTQIICICTPNTDDFFMDRRHLNEWRHYYPGEHVHYYNEASLVRLLKESGFEPIGRHFNESVPRDGGGPANIITISGRRG